jgi:hypothetical protein
MSDHDKIESIIKSLQKINVPDPADDVIVPNHPVSYQGSGSNRQQIFEQQNKLTEVLEQFIAFDPNADAIYAGSLIQGKSLVLGDLTPFAVARNPLTITITGLVSADPTVSFSSKVNIPSNASVVDAVSKILAQNLNTQQPARVTYSKTTVHSVEEAALRLGASYSWITGHVSGSFQTSQNTAYSSIMVRFVQNYYTVSCEPQSSPAAFISNREKYSDFTQYAAAGSPPTYVASTTFGRELWLLFESTSSESDMSATLDAAFGGGSATMSDTQKQILNESSIQILVIGGGGDSAIKTITGDKVGQLSAFLSAGANYSKESPGALISYVCRYMVDNSTARVSSWSDYTIRTSVNSPVPSLTDIIFNINTGDDDKDDDNHVSIQFTLLSANTVLYRDPDVPPKQPNDGDPTWHDNTTNQIHATITNVYQDTPGAQQIYVAISKSGDAHWHFGFDFLVKFSDGNTVPVASHDRNAHNFGDHYNSDNWTFTLPWEPSSQSFLKRRLSRLMSEEHIAQVVA